MRYAIGMSLVVLSLSLEPAHGAVDFDTSPGRDAVFAAASSVGATVYTAPLLSATLQRAKSHRVVTVQVTAHFAGILTNSTNVFQLAATVNETYALEGGVISQCPADGNSGGCTLSATFLFDVDSVPGLVGQPLEIEVYGGPFQGTSQAYVTLVARMERK